MVYFRGIKAEKLKGNLHAETDHERGHNGTDADKSPKIPTDDNGCQFNSTAADTDRKPGLAGKQDHQPIAWTGTEGGGDIKLTAECDSE